MDLSRAQQIADELIEVLAPTCEWVGVAGSIRRRKPNPKDVEIVYVPRLEVRQVDLFGSTEEVPLTDRAVSRLVEAGVLTWDEEVKRRTSSLPSGCPAGRPRSGRWNGCGSGCGRAS